VSKLTCSQGACGLPLYIVQSAWHTVWANSHVHKELVVCLCTMCRARDTQCEQTHIFTRSLWFSFERRCLCIILMQDCCNSTSTWIASRRLIIIITTNLVHCQYSLQEPIHKPVHVNIGWGPARFGQPRPLNEGSDVCGHTWAAPAHKKQQTRGVCVCLCVLCSLGLSNLWARKRCLARCWREGTLKNKLGSYDREPAERSIQKGP